MHDAALVEHLATIWADWEAGGYPADYGRDRVVPYVFPTAAMLAGLPARRPAATHAQVGLYCYDTMTLIGPGSWEAIRAAADCARTAAALIVSRRARPPTRCAARLATTPGPAGYGGSCYLNNAAVAAQALRQAGADRVAVLDIDAHHGNGTPGDLLWPAGRLLRKRPRRPGRRLVPALHGLRRRARERGRPRLPTATSRWRPAAATTRGSTRSACCATTSGRSAREAIVLSLGVDAAAADPESPLQVSADAYRRPGELIGALGPVAAVQEGGYDLASLGEYVLATLTGVAAGRATAGFACP